MSHARTQAHQLQVDSTLYDFINQEVLPPVGIAQDTFWKGFSDLVMDLAPRNAALLAERDRLQTALDQWHSAHPGPITDLPAYRAFLEGLGYLVPVPADAQNPMVWTGRPDALAITVGGRNVAPLGTALQDLQIQEPSLEDVYFDLRKG